eukprot:CAMPEP_0113399678 /NCGR_PEP_ID=MMETSP0013_2-20120614/15682_1 /TAXON_ID=2843 ORGANISM="Skeletonema costatum, Strain 1716" /NCGR_SAMPLE_ID=MMETSP0013_2 /ASSEMBLY_ACC=CAM_ASM_000158 /LENGTH=858 /DNA_ID=CAMNT_0000284625 /DNA_START=84 /DNA_END=2661 /DNA_ORIENTATION=+ /assembly_acc=CAM_ASM_000158
MTMLGFISSTSRRTVVRAAFTAGDVGSKTAFGRVGHTNVRPFISHAKSSPKFALYEREPINRAMSTSTDQELDSALDELLGDALKGVEAPAAEESALDELLNEALKEAETPAAEAGSGHIEGSHPFPKDLIEKETEEDFTNPKFLSTSNPRWSQIGVSQDVIDVLSHKGITHFTPVQAKSLRPVLAGRDVIGRSRTGTGKTLAFGIPALTRIAEIAKQTGNAEVMRDGSVRMRRGRLPSMIVLCPTRELAKQVGSELQDVCKPLGLFSTVFHGGVSYDPQSRALRQGVDVVVGTPGRIMDHLDRGNLNLAECNVVVLDEADEMLNMGFAEDVEVILEGAGDENDKKMQCLLFSATTPPWVKQIGSRYQTDALSVDITGQQQGARTATTVRHTAIQVPFGADAKKAILEDIIAVEISKDINLDDAASDDEHDENGDVDDEQHNAIAAAANAKKDKSHGALQQKIFGKTIVFTETKAECDELVSGSVFKTLTAQAIHGDIGQKQREATLAAFRAGAFNVLVATDVAARGIDIKDVDLVIQFHPPRDDDTYVHRSGRTGRAGAKGISVLLFQQNQARDIVRIERSLGHGFKFELLGPPSIEAALNAAAKTSAIACKTVADETAEHFKEAARALLANGDAEDTVARCLAAISRRTMSAESRSLLTGEAGYATVEMTNSKGRPISPGDVMFTVSKLSRMSQKEGGESSFDGDVGKIQTNFETGNAIFDMGVEDAKRLIEFSKDIDAGGAAFSIMKELEIERGRNFGQSYGRGGGGGVEDAVVDVEEAEEEAVVEEEGMAIAEILGEMIAEVEEEAGDTLTDMTTAVEEEEEIVDLTKAEEAEEEISVAHQGPSKGVMNGKVIN